MFKAKSKMLIVFLVRFETRIPRGAVSKRNVPNVNALTALLFDVKIMAVN